MKSEKNYYDILGVKESASSEEIRAAYKALVAKYHPDQYNGHPLEELAKEKLGDINEAYSVLSDAQRRRHYDMGRRMGLGGNSGSVNASRSRQPISPEQFGRKVLRNVYWIIGAFFLIRFGMGLIRPLFAVMTRGRGIPALVVIIGVIAYLVLAKRKRGV